MKFQWVPLLGLQRAVYETPISQRFDRYLDIMMGMSSTTGKRNKEEPDYPPLVHLNPMAKTNCMMPLLDHLEHTLQAEQVIGPDVIKTFNEYYKEEEEHDVNNHNNNIWKVGMVIVDDAGGIWTNYADVEYSHLFDNQYMLQRHWIDVLVWSSNTAPTKDSIRWAMETCLYRTVHQLRQERQQTATHNCGNNNKKTLGELLNQEAWVWNQVSSYDRREQPPAQEIERAIQILNANALATDYPTIMAALFGDQAAQAMGHPVLSLGDWCGLDLCRHGLWKLSHTENNDIHQ